MRRNQIALLLSALLLFALCCSGCQSGGAPSDQPPATTDTQPPADTADGQALDWPKRTITIQTTEPGGDMDYMARLLAAKMTEDLGVTVVVANNEGAVPPIRNMLSADSDGYTIWVGKTSLPIEQALGSMDDIDLSEDITYICNLVDNPALCITVKPELGVQTIQELIDLSKTKPGELCITDNIGSNTNVTCGADGGRRGWNLREDGRVPGGPLPGHGVQLSVPEGLRGGRGVRGSRPGLRGEKCHVPRRSHMQRAGI